MMNNAVGGGGGSISNSAYPQTMLVDYVKVTQNGTVTLFDDFTGTAPTPTCDLNGDGTVNAVDVQLAVNQALGVVACTTADVDQDGKCTVVDVQRIVNASLGQACRVGP